MTDHNKVWEAMPAPSAISDGVILICGSMLTPKPIVWLWRHWLAQGKFHLLAGAPGTGKTTLIISVAATITTAGKFPDGETCEVGNVVVWSGEDDPENTLLPRFIAAGGDPSRLHFIDATRIDGEIVPFDPSRDLGHLLEALDAIGDVKMVMVDPVVSAVAGDSHKNGEVRRALQPLVDLASATGAAVVGISHFSKGGQGQDPTQRVIGSVAFAAVARVVMVAAKVKNPEGEDRRILARSKSNIGPDAGGFEYSLEVVEALPGIESSRIAWGQALDGTARELLAEPDDESSGSDQNDAAEMLRAELTADTWTNSGVAQQPLKDAGFSKKQIWSASKKLNVQREKGKNGPHDAWYWRLPASLSKGSKDDKDCQGSSQDYQDSQLSNGESWEPWAESCQQADPAEVSL